MGSAGPTAEGDANAPRSAAPLEARLVRIAELSFGYTPRQSPLDEEHVNSLVEVVDRVPPIIVDRRTMMVIDGLHRTEAARRAGHVDVRAALFSGSGTDAMALAIKANVGHGKPLTRAERRAAAGMLLGRVPERSDRWVAEVCGLSDTTVGRVREEVRAKGLVRTGRDGRSRAVDSAPGRAAVANALTANAGGSLRRAARLAGVSPNTARRVATKLARKGRPQSDQPASQATAEEEPLIDLTRLSGPQRGVSWWEGTAVFPADLGAHLGELPMAQLTELVGECRRRGHTWLGIAEDLEQKGDQLVARAPIQAQVIPGNNATTDTG